MVMDFRDDRAQREGIFPQFGELTEQSYRLAISKLIERDRGLAGVVAKWGIPPFRTHPPGFQGIVLAILAQQVSLESARATFRKLENAISAVTPDAFLTLHTDTLREIGFSRQKASYVRKIAEDLVAARIDLEALQWIDDTEAGTRLMQIRGVGKWTADTYLLFSLRRSDVWPSGDLALEKAVSEIKGLPSKPRTEEVDRIAAAWKPLRAVAARILWHQYLNQRGRFHSA
jgi:DNA-3-methyladenine glycosylase II